MGVRGTCLFLFRAPAATRLVRVYGRERSGWSIGLPDDSTGINPGCVTGSSRCTAGNIEWRR
jgi:hypothetical protein